MTSTIKTNPLKRRRPVTACLECYRRKQKCNRVKPCNTCLARNIPEKYTYEDEILLSTSKTESTDDSPSYNSALNQHNEEEIPSTNSSLDEQIGYSNFNSNNAYNELQKSLNAQSIGSTLVTSVPRFALHVRFQERYFQLATRLPSRTICKALVEIYFAEADWYFMALDRHYFDRLHSDWDELELGPNRHNGLQHLSRDLHYFPALLFQVLAAALQFLAPGSHIALALRLSDNVACDKLSDVWSKVGLEIMTLLGRHKPAITAIEFDLMRATWLKNCSRGSEAWYSVGNAIRLAQELGLHLQSDIEQTAEVGLEETLNQIFTLYITYFKLNTT